MTDQQIRQQAKALLEKNTISGHPDRLLIVKGWMVNHGMLFYHLRFSGFQAELVDKA